MYPTKSTVSMLIIAMIFVTGFAPNQNQQAEINAIKKVCFAETAAFLRRDDFAQRGYMTNDHEFVGVNYYNGSARGAAWHNKLDPNKKTEDPEFQAPFPLRFENNDHIFHINGNLAWVSYTQNMTETAHGREITWTNRENRVLRKENDEWKIVAITTVGTGCNDPEMYHIKEKLNDIGNQLLENREYDKATKVYLLITDLFPESAHGYDAVAWGYYHQGDKENMVKYAKKALLQLPHDEFTPNWRKDQIKEWAEGKLEMAKEME